MKLGDWLKRENITLEDFGRRIHRSHSAVSRYVSGERVPGKVTMDLIRTETGGDVTPNDFYGDGETVVTPIDDDNGGGGGEPSNSDADRQAAVVEAPQITPEVAA